MNEILEKLKEGKNNKELSSEEVIHLEKIKVYIRELILKLSPREQKVINMRFGLIDDNKRTLEYIGEELNITRERVRQIEVKALNKIKKMKLDFDKTN